ncbi:MAG: hypothetical protein IT442_11430 [Phycisphaeraceae bacterium]|nr:hypothetical protein [Phycisphaeraceae bacterium]
MLIIYGTRICGKKNVRYVRTICKNCGTSGTFESYEGRNWFTLYFLPIIPGEIRHIRHECPSCKKCFNFTPRKWRKLQRDAVEPRLAAYRSAPENVEAAEAALQALIDTADHEHFTEIAVLIEQNLSANRHMLGLLAQAYSAFMMDGEAEAAFEAVLAQGEDSDVRRAFVRHLLLAGKIEQAKSELETIEQAQGDKPSSLRMLLIEAYQSLGQHEQALDEIQTFQGWADPDQLKILAQMEKISTKGARSGKPIRRKGPAIVHAGTGEPMRKPLRSKLQPVLAACVVALMAGMYTFLSATARVDNAFLVNGLAEPYEVLVNGQPVRVSNTRATPIDLPMGRSTIEQAPGSIEFEPIIVEPKCSFFARPMFKGTIVVNPDGAAALIHSEVYYAAKPARPPEGRQWLEHSKIVYQFDNVEYPFSSPPAQITLDQNKSVVSRRSLALLKDASIPQIASMLDKPNNHAQAAGYLRLVLDRQPRIHADLLAQLGALVEPAELRSFVASKLDVRPAMIEWHRIWQDLTERLEPQRDLTAEYRKHVAADPADKGLKYLLARVEDDPARGHRLCREAIAEPDPCPYGYLWLSFEATRNESFAEARRLAESAVRLAPDSLVLRDAQRRALFACRDYQGLLNLAQRQLEDDPANVEAVMTKLQSLIKLGSVAEAKQTRDAWLAAMCEEDPEGGKKMADLVRNWLTAAAAAAADDDRTYLAAQRKINPQSVVLATLEGSRERLEHVIQQANADNQPLGASEHATIYVVADARGHDTLAVSELKVLVDLLSQGPPEDRKLAAWLSSDTPPSPWDVMLHTGTIADIRLVYAAIATRHPQVRDQYLRMARVMDYDPDPVHMILRPVLARASAATAESTE